MSASSFRVRLTSHYERDVRRYTKRERNLLAVVRETERVLSEDPKNISGKYDIKKLKGVKLGGGQWRITIGDYRMRYDVFDNERVVLLYSFRHRREAYRS